MTDNERRDIIRTIRDEINMLKDFLDVKYATRESLQEAKERRDEFCLIREKKLDDKFKPLYKMLAVIIGFLLVTNGKELLNLLMRVM